MIGKDQLDALVPVLNEGGPIDAAARFTEAGIDPVAIDDLGNELASYLLMQHEDLGSVRKDRLGKALKLAFKFGAELTALALTTIEGKDDDESGDRNQGD